MSEFNISFLLLFNFSFAVFAQKKDSSALANANASMLLFSDTAQLVKFSFAKSNSYYLQDLMPQKVSRAGLTYRLVKGNYITAQNAAQINSGNFFTEGTVKLGAVKLYGNLNYQKIFEDSVAFAHQTRSNTTTPYYFGSPAYVHYERSIYNFRAMSSKNMWRNKLMVSVGTDYKIGSHFATNDPRGALSEYQFNINGNIACNMSALLKVGVGYLHGYGREEVMIGYKNPRYYESSAFPVYYNRLVNGYREWGDALTRRKYDNKMVRNRADIFVDIKTPALGAIYFNGGYADEHQEFFYSNDSGILALSNYNLKSATGNVMWMKQAINQTFGVTINYISQSGRDFNFTYKSNNYVYNSANTSLKFFLNKTVGKTTYSYQLGAQQNSEERTDGIGGNNIYFNNLKAGIGFGMRKLFSEKQLLLFYISGDYIFPISRSFKLTPNAGYFTKYVINRDYVFNTSAAVGGNFSIEYGFPAFKAIKTTLKLDMGYQNKLSEQIVPGIAFVALGNTRFFTNAGLNLYF